jgi:hypothetical protein
MVQQRIRGFRGAASVLTMLSLGVSNVSVIERGAATVRTMNQMA